MMSPSEPTPRDVGPPADVARLPLHHDPIDPEGLPIFERLSFSPYNFVPLPEAVLPAVSTLGPIPPPWEHHDEYLPGTYTGWLELTITAETPLYVRCAPPSTSAGDENTRTNRARQDFFHLGDPGHPAIPGSSLRGMLRAMVEILASAKLAKGWFSDRKLIYRAVGDTTSLGIDYRETVLGSNQNTLPYLEFDYPVSRLRGGYLRKQGPDWYIQPARTVNGESFVHVEYSAVPWFPRHHPRHNYSAADLVNVYIKPPAGRAAPYRSNPNLTLHMAYLSNPAEVDQASAGVTKRPGFETAVLVLSGHMGGRTEKHMHCAIYEPDPGARAIPIPRETWLKYEDDRELSRGIEARPLGEEPSRVAPTETNPERSDPLFFLLNEEGDLVFFGPTMMFRLPYPNSIADFVPTRIRDRRVIDLAEAIFGTVDRSPAIKGRLFVEDALWDRSGGSPFFTDHNGYRTPRILGTPKPTSFQHYLVQPLVRPPRGPQQPAANLRGSLCNYHHPLGSGPYDFPDNNGRSVAQSDGTVIRGSKRYWHKRDAPDDQRFLADLAQENRPGAKQLTIIRPVKPCTSFRGRIRFENLTNVELGALLTALQLKPSQRHQIGMGKPLGLGSIRIESSLRLTDRHARYDRLFDDAGDLVKGERSISETESTRQACLESFASTLLTHHNQTSGEPLPPESEVWSIPRLRAFAALLEWDDTPPVDRTGYAPPDTLPGDLKWWRERPVLPTVEFVAGIEVISAPVSPNPQPSGSPDGSIPESHDQPKVPNRPNARTSESLGPPKPATYKAQEKIPGVLLDEKTKKGGWMAVIKGTDLKGHIQGTPPSDAAAGQEVTLVVASFTPPKTISFWWSGAAPKANPTTNPKSGKGNSHRR
jgi:CRISPR-associated protein (TIGR03986 family)